MANLTRLILQGLGFTKKFIDMRDGSHAEQVAQSFVHTRGMEWYTATGLGLLSPDVRRVTALGNNPDVDVGSVPEDVWSGGGLYPFMAAATSLELVSSSASDTSAGTGARTVLVSGLDAAYVEQSDTITMNGLTAVALPRQYFRINQLLVLTAGTAENNVGDLTLRDAGAGATRAIIPATSGISRQAVFTVPAGHTLSVHSLFVSLNRTSGIDKNITVGLTFRTSTGVRRLTLEFSVSSVVPYRHEGIPGIILPEKTDVSMRTTFTASSDVDITGAFLGVLVSNTSLTA